MLGNTQATAQSWECTQVVGVVWVTKRTVPSFIVI